MPLTRGLRAAVFQTRVGLTALELLRGPDPTHSRLVCAIGEVAALDANAAREFLDHHSASRLTGEQKHRLAHVVNSGELGAKALGVSRLRAFTTAVDTAEVTLRGLLSHHTGTSGPETD